MKRPTGIPVGHLGILLLLAVLALVAAAGSIPTAVMAARPAALSVLTFEKGAFRKFCSGAIVQLSEGPRLVTAGHCADYAVQHGEQVAIKDAQGHLWPADLERYQFNYKVHPQEDFAVYDTPLEYLVPAIHKARAALVVGEDVYMWTGPVGLDLLLFAGTYAGKEHGDNAQNDMAWGLDYFDINGAPGSSGSIILNSAGEAVSILTLGWDTNTKLDGVMGVALPQ